jgi:hypothetical protein
MTLGKTHHVPNGFCPLCGKELDAASGMDHDNAPKPGDVSVCLGCAQPLVFNDDLTVRAMTASEVADLPLALGRQIRRAMWAARQLDRRQ